MYALEGFVVQLKQYLQRCPNPRYLKLAPKSAFVTTGAVEDSRDVPEVVLELITEFLHHRCVRTKLGRSWNDNVLRHRRP